VTIKLKALLQLLVKYIARIFKPPRKVKESSSRSEEIVET